MCLIIWAKSSSWNTVHKGVGAIILDVMTIVMVIDILVSMLRREIMMLMRPLIVVIGLGARRIMI